MPLHAPSTHACSAKASLHSPGPSQRGPCSRPVCVREQQRQQQRKPKRRIRRSPCRPSNQTGPAMRLITSLQSEQASLYLIYTRRCYRASAVFACLSFDARLIEGVASLYRKGRMIGLGSGHRSLMGGERGMQKGRQQLHLALTTCACFFNSGILHEQCIPQRPFPFTRDLPFPPSIFTHDFLFPLLLLLTSFLTCLSLLFRLRASLCISHIDAHMHPVAPIQAHCQISSVCIALWTGNDMVCVVQGACASSCQRQCCHGHMGKPALHGLCA